jgi:threonyl-tRNA synthetase
VQARIIQVTQEHGPYAREVEAELKKWGVRVERDSREEKLGKKIRDAQLEKIPYMLVIGAKEAGDRSISVRSRSGDQGSKSWADLFGMLKDEFDPFSDRSEANPIISG